MGKLISIALLAVFLMVGKAEAIPASFYGTHHDITTQADFIRTFNSNSLQADRQRVVATFNADFGQQLGAVANFDALVARLASGEFEVRPCTAHVTNYGIAADGSFVVVGRPCYDGERMLVHRTTGLAVFSLVCGNLQKPPARVVEQCMLLAVRFPQGTVGLKARLTLWGSNATPGCGLTAVACANCFTQDGVAANAAFVAPLAEGGYIKLPRAMVAGLTRLCVEFDGHLASDGVHPAKIIQGDLAGKARARAVGESRTVLAESEWLGFH